MLGLLKQLQEHHLATATRTKANSINLSPPWPRLRRLRRSVVFGQVQDHEVAFSLSFAQLEDVIEGLEATHKAGAARYPVTNWMNYTGSFPPSYEQYRQRLDEIE